EDHPLLGAQRQSGYAERETVRKLVDTCLEADHAARSGPEERRLDGQLIVLARREVDVARVLRHGRIRALHPAGGEEPRDQPDLAPLLHRSDLSAGRPRREKDLVLARPSPRIWSARQAPRI